MPGQFQYYDVAGQRVALTLVLVYLGLRFAGPIIYAATGRGRGIRVTSRTGGEVTRNRMRLTKQESKQSSIARATF